MTVQIGGGEPLARLAARRIRNIACEPLEPAVRHKAALCLLDFLGCCVAGRRMPWAPALLRFADDRAGTPEAYHWSLGRRVSAGMAAFGNGVLGHSIIRDDMHVASGSHIGVLILPAAIALAERDDLPGRALLAGIVAGYEMAGRLGTAVRGSGAFNRHFRPSGIVGAFGAAAAACAASQLDEDRTVHALGFGANFACGLNEWAWSGGQELFAHAGMAAQSGLNAFDLACSGMQSSETILEGADGVFAAYGCGSDAARIFASSLSEDYCILGVRHKPNAGCNFIQTPIAAALEAAKRLNSPNKIDEIVIRTFGEAQCYPGCDYTGPFTSLQQSKMSLQYGVSAALLWGRVDENAYARLADPVLNALVSRCRIELDAGFAEAFPARQGAAIDVRLHDGSRTVATLDDVPWLDDTAVEARFLAEMADYAGAAAANRILEAAHGLNDLESSRDLFALFPSRTPEPVDASRSDTTPRRPTTDGL